MNSLFDYIPILLRCTCTDERVPPCELLKDSHADRCRLQRPNKDSVSSWLQSERSACSRRGYWLSRKLKYLNVEWDRCCMWTGGDRKKKKKRTEEKKEHACGWKTGDAGTLQSARIDWQPRQLCLPLFKEMRASSFLTNDRTLQGGKKYLLRDAQKSVRKTDDRHSSRAIKRD